ncbi:MAG: hypothetical protein JST93_05440 [Acidobacteria bacterium]|nr:hypothetical protein [Acidobacteriota bacterium]
MQTYYTTRFGRGMTGLAAAVVGVIVMAGPAQAGYVHANVNVGNGLTNCGGVDEPFLSCPVYNGPVMVELGSSKAYTDFGVNKVLAQGSDSASSQWKVGYTLSGTVGTPVSLTVEIAYDVNISPANNSETLFRMALNNDFFGTFDISINTDGLGNICDDQPVGAPCLSGQHSGIWTRTVSATAGQYNNLFLSVSASVFNGGWVDAYNTVTINRIIVPDGVTWAYDGISGNPLNFQYASDSTVPEPAAVQLLGAGLALAAIGRWWRKGV